jgi:hypothetical protein
MQIVFGFYRRYTQIHILTANTKNYPFPIELGERICFWLISILIRRPNPYAIQTVVIRPDLETDKNTDMYPCHEAFNFFPLPFSTTKHECKL